jgi:hypothetical protein
MSTRRFPAAPNSKPSQLPYGWGLGTGCWGLGTARKKTNSKFKIPSHFSRTSSPVSRVPIITLSIICQKKNGLAVFQAKAVEMYVIEIERVIEWVVERG